MRYCIDNGNMYKKGQEWDMNSPKEILKYAVGPLMYTPANHKTIGKKICNSEYKTLKSVAFCLEDSILEANVEEAEEQLTQTIKEIWMSIKGGKLDKKNLPLIFIRVRNSKEMKVIVEKLLPYMEVVAGLIFPKFSRENKEEYIINFIDLNRQLEHKIYAMPILEDSDILSIETRKSTLMELKHSIDGIKDYVLNVRIGGNDFCNFYGFRRGKENTIYDIGVIKDVMSDIINIFGREYVVSAAVYEYFGDEDKFQWKQYLRKEIALDRMNGFIGKTLIHPTQISVFEEEMPVEYDDYIDALSILDWKSSTKGVEKSNNKAHRMNEVKVHKMWAEKITNLAYVYGVKAE